MRRLLAGLAGALLVFAVAAGAAGAQTIQSVQRTPSLRAKAAIVVETSTGNVALRKQSRMRRSMASTTKLMTALVTLERADLDDVFSATSYRASPVESQIGLRPGERMTVRDLMRALLLESANDAAATLAVGTLGSRRAFVREMNRRARALGLTDTSYANPVGLDEEGNHSSARDLALLATRLRRNEFFRRTIDLPRATLRSGARTRTVVNRNTLLRRQAFVNGVKTGRTIRAGYVQVGSASRRGVTVVSVVMGEPSERARNEETLTLLRFGLSRYRAATPLPQGRVLGRVPLRYRSGEHVDLVAGRSVKRVLRRGQRARVTATGIPAVLDGPLPRGSRAGTATVRVGGRVIARVPLVTAKPVTEAGLGTRLDDLARRPLTVVALCVLLACSLPLVALRRRAIRRRRSLDAQRRRARRREETPVT